MKTILTTHFIICILLLPGWVEAQVITISGNVTNSIGEVLENVSIFESNRKIGTITNQKGFFKLVLSKGEVDLKISDSGFKDFSQEIVLLRDTTFLIQLAPEIHSRGRNKKPNIIQADAKTHNKFVGNRGFK